MMNDSYETIRQLIADRLHNTPRLIIGIDGCCASGKTTLAQRLYSDFGADLIHMDDFFLPPSLRTPARYEEPGGNIHYERFFTQIARPLLKARSHTAPVPSGAAGGCPGAPAQTARPAFVPETGWPMLHWDRFVCSMGDFSPDLCHTGGKPLLIIEGSYCMRPEFRPLYDLSFFMSTSYEQQLRRIRERSPQRLKMFTDKWIPLENRYFSYYGIPEQCLYQIFT